MCLYVGVCICLSVCKCACVGVCALVCKCARVAVCVCTAWPWFLCSPVVHVSAHLANLVNFSVRYSEEFPALNVARYRGEVRGRTQFHKHTHTRAPHTHTHTHTVTHKCLFCRTPESSSWPQVSPRVWFSHGHFFFCMLCVCVCLGIQGNNELTNVFKIRVAACQGDRRKCVTHTHTHSLEYILRIQINIWKEPGNAFKLNNDVMLKLSAVQKVLTWSLMLCFYWFIRCSSWGYWRPVGPRPLLDVYSLLILHTVRCHHQKLYNHIFIIILIQCSFYPLILSFCFRFVLISFPISSSVLF